MGNLEKRIVAALSDEISSKNLAALIAETGTAIAAAEEAAEAERTKALDPIASPNAIKAKAAMERAAFARDRLHTLLPRLRTQHHHVAARERAAAWSADYEQVKAKLDVAAQEFAERFPAMVTQMVDLFRRAEEVDKEVARINGSAPYDQHRRLCEVELTARRLNRFTRDSPSMVGRVQLPDPEHADRMVWPPPKVPLGVQIASSMTLAPGPAGDWAAGIEARAQDRRDESATVAAHYKAEAKDREERENAKVRRAVAARRRGA